MHLHGYCYYVMAQGVFPKGLKFDESIAFLNQELNSGLHVRPYPPMKDTVPLPSGGYFVVRIFSDNPGNIKFVREGFDAKRLGTP